MCVCVCVCVFMCLYIHTCTAHPCDLASTNNVYVEVHNNIISIHICHHLFTGVNM